MSTPTRRAVLFDLDNTLILEDASTHAAVREAARAAAERAGVDAERLATTAIETAERLWKAAPSYAYGEAFGIWWGEALWGGFTGAGVGLDAIRAFLPGFREAVWREALAQARRTDPRAARRDATDAAIAREMQDTYVRTRRARETIDPEAEPALLDLSRDHRLALLTNGAGDVQREKLARTPFARYFDVVVVSVEVGVGKPDPRFFEIALERLAVAKADATMVGDSLLRDVGGAQRAGLPAIWIDRGLVREEGPVPDATIGRLSDLRAALDGLERRTASARGMP